MSVLAIRKYPDPVLQLPYARVDQDRQEFVTGLVQDLWDTMEANGGIGLAAPQVGVNAAVMVMGNDKEIPRMAFVNPSISGDHFNGAGGPSFDYKYTSYVPKTLSVEGCLSLPGVKLTVSRPDKVKNVYYLHPSDLQTYGTHTLEGAAARVFWHEFDHLVGILIIDRVQGLAKKLAMEKYFKHQRREERESLRKALTR